MVEEKLPSLDEWELQVKNTTTTKHKQELRIIERFLNCYLAGFRIIDKFTIGEVSRLEIAWLVLVVRSFNSFRNAYDLLQKGYYTQAVMLIRSAEEDYLTCRHCEINQGTIDALLDGKGEFKRFAAMAKDISADFYKNWKINYGQVSEIAHPRQLAVAMVANRKAHKMNLGADYIENHFVATCHALLRSAVGMTEFLIKLLGDSAKQWQEQSYFDFKEACEYVERISEEVKGTTKNDS